MEMAQLLGGFVLVWGLVGVASQLVFAYALQAIAEKNDLPELPRFLAWIPLLQLYPMIRCGGGSFSRFCFGILGFVVAAIALFAAAGQMGEGIASKALIAMFCLAAVIVAVVYMARIVMETAARRGLPRALGLLAFVPLLNFFVYPYIAFHDGFVAPSKAGLVLGVLLAASPLAAQYRMAQLLSENPSAVLQAKLGTAGSLEPGSAETERALRERAESAIGAERSEPASAPAAPRVVHSLPRIESLTASAEYDPSGGFLVPDRPDCPKGTTQMGAGPPEGQKQWCERVGDGAGVKHGWFASWHPNGERAVSGEYHDGLRIGVWTRWYEDGKKRAQAQFDRGLQDGLLVAWDDEGRVVMERHFRSGEPTAGAADRAARRDQRSR